MNWLVQTLDQLSQQTAIGYAAEGATAAEPTAIAALALSVHGRAEAAREAAKALTELQAANGEVGVRAGEPTPGWPTSLAVVAWTTIEKASGVREHPGNLASPMAPTYREAYASRSP